MDEVQRYERFVQVKQALTRAQDYLLVGVDVAKAKHYACFMRSTGELLLKRFASGTPGSSWPYWTSY